MTRTSRLDISLGRFCLFPVEKVVLFFFNPCQIEAQSMARCVAPGMFMDQKDLLFKLIKRVICTLDLNYLHQTKTPVLSLHGEARSSHEWEVHEPHAKAGQIIP